MFFEFRNGFLMKLGFGNGFENGCFMGSLSWVGDEVFVNFFRLSLRRRGCGLMMIGEIKLFSLEDHHAESGC